MDRKTAFFHIKKTCKIILTESIQVCIKRAMKERDIYFCLEKAKLQLKNFNGTTDSRLKVTFYFDILQLL